MKLIRAGLIAVASAFLGLAAAAPAAAQQNDLGTVIIPPGARVDSQGRMWMPDPNAQRVTRNWHHGPRYNRDWYPRYDQRPRYYPRHDYRPRYRPRYHQPRTNLYLEFNVPSSRYVEPRRVRGTNAHYQWCYNRYKSYREWDNSWQPYNGPRRQCISPYVR